MCFDCQRVSWLFHLLHKDFSLEQTRWGSDTQVSFKEHHLIVFLNLYKHGW